MKTGDGIRFFVKHDRDYVPEGDPRGTGSPDRGGMRLSMFGGRTTVVIVDEETGSLLGHGVAVCRPDERFNRRLGRTIAWGRAQKVHKLLSGPVSSDGVETGVGEGEDTGGRLSPLQAVVDGTQDIRQDIRGVEPVDIQGLDLLLAEHPGHFVVRVETSPPWISVNLLSREGVRSRWAIFRRTGNVYRLDEDGTVPDDPTYVMTPL